MNAEYRYLKDGVAGEITQYLISDYDLTLSEALNILYESETYSKLCNPSTGLYFRGSRYVYSFLKNELNTGCFN